MSYPGQLLDKELITLIEQVKFKFETIETMNYSGMDLATKFMELIVVWSLLIDLREQCLS